TNVAFFSTGSSPLPTARVTVTGSTVSGNSVTASPLNAGQGGGLYFNLGQVSFGATPGGATTASVTASTIEGNSASNLGGGIYAQEAGTANSTATLTVTNSTLFGNIAANILASGGGLYNSATGPDGSAGVTLVSSTVAFNAAPGLGGKGGGIFAQGDHFVVRSSIVADNTVDPLTFGAGPDVFGNFTSLGHNLIGQTDGSTGFDGGDLTGTSANPLDPLFGDFGNHGGPTDTLALLSGSPAIGHGDPAGPATDQRGFTRSRTAPTIGAFEFMG